MSTNATLNLGTQHFKTANEAIRSALDEQDVIDLHEVYAQRYLGSAMGAGKRLNIFGTPGNDLACYLDGGIVEVFGNAQDQIGNTMNEGELIVHGRCGDAAGYAMRGGKIFVRDDCGWRVGVGMKEYKEKRPCIVIGGNAGNFLGEYQAGGIILLLGTAGDYLATGMHGGIVYLKQKLEDYQVLPGLVQEPVDEDDKKLIGGLLHEYNELFAEDLGEAVDESGNGFYRLRPASSRPYAAMYAN